MASADDNELIHIIENEYKEIIERNKETGWPDIDHQRRAFALEYVTDYDHRRAAKIAGFNPDRGVKLIREPLLSHFIVALQLERFNANIITREFIESRRLRLLDMVMGDVPAPHITPQGEEIEARKLQADSARGVLSDMEKAIGEGKVNAGITVQINVAGLIGEQGAVIDGEVVDE